jgi:hypothetical protein
MHPLFTQNLSELSDDALHKKHGEILKRINQASRLGYGDAMYQLQMVLNQFNDEIINRNRREMEKLRQKNDRDFDDYINIG